MRSDNSRLIAAGCAALAVLAGVSSCDSPRPSKAVSSPQEEARGVTLLAGSPEDIGRSHGMLLADGIRIMIREYVGDDATNGKLGDRMQARVDAMEPSLPDWYMREIVACARAVGMDEDVLLYAQCEGDIKSLGGCTTYVAFGPATHDGTMEIGRNFDYWGLESTDKCVAVFAVVPNEEDGYAFVSVGWSGILGGWTFLNEKGLFVANNLGGGMERNPRGVPTLILERIVAQKAATIEEAVAIVETTPRMRGQALVIGQAGDEARGVAPDAVVIEYDAATVEVRRTREGFAFDSSIGTDMASILEVLRNPGRKPIDAIKSAGAHITLHSVAMRPQQQRIWVAHGLKPSAHLGEYVEYDVRALLRRE
jgi:hypothetical protein